MIDCAPFESFIAPFSKKQTRGQEVNALVVKKCSVLPLPLKVNMHNIGYE
jgi:hypothetical protein